MGIIEMIEKKLEDTKKKRIELRDIKADIYRRTALVKKEEMIKQAVKTAEFKEKFKGEQERSYIKNGGMLGSISKAIGNASENLAKNTAPPKTEDSKMKKKTKKQKSKKNRKKSLYPYNENMTEDIGNFEMDFDTDLKF